MIVLTRLCLNPILPRISQISRSRITNLVSQNQRNIFSIKPEFWNKQALKNPKQNSGSLLRKNGTITLDLAANVSTKPKKAVGYWLATCSGMVFIAVALGGVTRLTKSGLSMVTWKLFGEKLPTSEEEWVAEFNRYKEFPEFKITNKEMTLNEFKWIWYMEFVHRSWGRALGAVFAIPAAVFWARGMLTKRMKTRVLILGGLIGVQGLMGWYMVKSGLEDRFHGESDVPRVSQYRLASHLTMAFILYALFLSSTLEQFIPAQTGVKAARGFRMLAHTCKGFVFLTAISGAFVAGIEAGLVYNSFPKMADRWIPSDILAFEPTIRNFTENPTTVQFDHRLLGITTLSLISGLWLLSRRHQLPPRAYKAANLLAGLAYLQVTLGISTLLTYVPVWLAACHQSGSLALLSSAIWLTHELKKIPK